MEFHGAADRKQKSDAMWRARLGLTGEWTSLDPSVVDYDPQRAS